MKYYFSSIEWRSDIFLLCSIVSVYPTFLSLRNRLIVAFISRIRSHGPPLTQNPQNIYKNRFFFFTTTFRPCVITFLTGTKRKVYPARRRRFRFFAPTFWTGSVLYLHIKLQKPVAICLSGLVIINARRAGVKTPLFFFVFYTTSS